MKRRFRIALAAGGLALVLVFALGVALSPPRTPTIAVIGDRAEELSEALKAERREEAPRAATVTFVLLHRWENLRHLPDIAERCWDACHDRAAAQISLTRMRFGATDRTVVFHLPSFDGDFGCIAARARGELAGLRTVGPSCRADAARLSVYILPLGLGRIS